MLWIDYLSLVKFRLAIVFIMDESYWWKVENNFTLFTDHFECSYENDLYYGWKNLNSFLKSYILYTVFITWRWGIIITLYVYKIMKNNLTSLHT